MQKLWYCQISRNQTVLGHGDTMIHKHSANLFLPEQAPMGCTSYGPRSHQAAEQVLSQTAERAWAQPQARACSAFWLEPIGSQHKAQLSLTDARRTFAWMSPGSSSAAQGELQYQNSSLCWSQGMEVGWPCKTSKHKQLKKQDKYGT